MVSELCRVRKWIGSRRKRKRRNRTYEPAPAGALDGRGGGVELRLEGFEGAEGLDDRVLERAVAEDAAGAFALGGRWGEVLPEERVVDMACVGWGS